MLKVRLKKCKFYNLGRIPELSFGPRVPTAYQKQYSYCAHQQSCRFQTRNIHFATSDQQTLSSPEAFADRNQEEKDEQEDIRQTTSRPKVKDDTLTDSERAIFQQIYKDAAERSNQHGRSEEGRIERLIGETDQEHPPQDSLSAIFDRAKDTIRANHHTRKRPPSVLDAHQRPEADPRRVPPELTQHFPIFRTHNTLRALEQPQRILPSGQLPLQHLGQPQQNISLAQDSSPSATPAAPPSLIEQTSQGIDVIEACNTDAIRVDGLLEGAETDTEIWRILQKEVFAQVEFFSKAMKAEKEGVGDVETARKKKKKQQRKKRDRQAMQNTAELSSIRALSIATSPDKYPQLALPFAVIRSNYAHHCWAAVRMLRVRFPRSPYATAILPTIKSLGPISYVLGASTELYNELLFLRWAHYRDLQACADLLAEMLDRGIPTSIWTRAVFRDAAKHWLSARKELTTPMEDKKMQENQAAESVSAEVARLPSRSKAKQQQIRPFELAWWSLEGVQSGFKRWEVLETEARRRHAEEAERQKRALQDNDEDDNEGAHSSDQPALAQSAGDA